MLVKQISGIDSKKTVGKSSGVRDTFVAKLYDRDIDKVLPVHFKIFPEDCSGKCRFNEFLGRQLVNAFDLDTPELFLAFCDPHHLRKYAASLCRPVGENPIPGVASLNARLVLQMPHDNELFRTQLLKWPKIAALAAVDELIANVDRTSENILQIGQRFIPIDHDNCLGCEARELSAIEEALTGATMRNHVAEMIGGCSDEALKTKMIEFAEMRIKKMKFAAMRFPFDVDNFFQLENGTIKTVLGLLDVRKIELGRNLYRYVEMHSMFQTGAQPNR